MKNIKLLLEYDGTNFAGWQWQPNRPTLQGALEEAIKKTSGEEIRVTASGRTDAGVHARGQVVSFLTGAGLEGASWRGALNHRLPREMRVLDAREAQDGFNARHSARGKLYEYKVINRPVPSALMVNRAWHVGTHLDMGAMQGAARLLMGEHDFTAFRAADCDAKNPVRTLWRLDIERDGETMTFSLGASAFLRHMSRNIVGTLVEVGRGRMPADGMEAILAARDRARAGPTAPPQGLYLINVLY